MSPECTTNLCGGVLSEKREHQKTNTPNTEILEVHVLNSEVVTAVEQELLFITTTP